MRHGLDGWLDTVATIVMPVPYLANKFALTLIKKPTSGTSSGSIGQTIITPPTSPLTAQQQVANNMSGSNNTLLYVGIASVAAIGLAMLLTRKKKAPAATPIAPTIEVK